MRRHLPHKRASVTLLADLLSGPNEHGVTVQVGRADEEPEVIWWDTYAVHLVKRPSEEYRDDSGRYLLYKDVRNRWRACILADGTCVKEGVGPTPSDAMLDLDHE